MAIARGIFGYTTRIFDVVGSCRGSSGDNLLVLGLESTPERNLDDFGCVGGVLQMYGFREHVGPRVESVVNFIHNIGFAAEPVGRYGYPREGVLNLKEAAILAGLGGRGKNTVVLHPKYGPRLRFAAIRTDAPLDPPASSALAQEGSSFCSGCSICIDACPVKTLEPYRMLDALRCLSNTPIMAEEQGRLVPCDICLHMCPAGKQ